MEFRSDAAVTDRSDVVDFDHARVCMAFAAAESEWTRC